MSLQAVIAEIDPAWFVPEGESLDPALLTRARSSRIGQRLLARWLAGDHAGALLGPTPQRDVGAAARRWSRRTIQALTRDLGVLAMAPAIRAEVGREPVKRLKHALGNSYLLALDPTIWDARVPAAVTIGLVAELRDALAADPTGPELIYALFEYRGRSELRAWARNADPALGEWTALLHAREPELAAVLPAAQVQMLREHHLAREPGQ